VLVQEDVISSERPEAFATDFRPARRSLSPWRRKHRAESEKADMTARSTQRFEDDLPIAHLYLAVVTALARVLRNSASSSR
jgi:hypothetical protein